MYKKVERRLERISGNDGISFTSPESQQIINLSNDLKMIADSYGLEIRSCAEEIDLVSSGIRSGKCIDNDLLNSYFDMNIPYRKDPNQRKACRCTASVDIGAYDTCGYRCVYCYANSSFEKAAANLKAMDIDSESLYHKSN